jgi:raffinose/stachyose/melibiose transport system permease protein
MTTAAQGKGQRPKRRKADALVFYICIMAIPVIQFCVFYIGVNFNSILLAFKKYDAVSSRYSWVGFDNFRTFIEGLGRGLTLSIAVRNSLILYAVNLILGLPLALVFSYYIFRRAKGYNAARIFLFLPSIFSNIVMAIIFNYLMALVLPAAGLKDYLGDPTTQFYAIVFFNVWVGFGASVLIYSGAMSQVSDSVLDAARIDGASKLREFWSIVLPAIFPTLTTFLVVGIAQIFINQASIFSFYAEGAAERTYTLGYWLFVKVVGQSGGPTQYPLAAAAGLQMTLIAVPLTMLVKFLLEKFGPSEN